MSKKLCKIWNNSLKKAVLASSFNELIVEGAKKLQLENCVISAYLEDGTDLEDNEIFEALPAGTVIYLLTDTDKRPWEEDTPSCTEVAASSFILETSNIISPKIKNPCIYSPVKGFKNHQSWPSTFVIPVENFSEDLKAGLDCGNVAWAEKSELLSHLSQEIQKFTTSPTVAQRDIVARELVKQFPSLKSSIGEGHEGWVLKIYDRIKHDTRKKNIVRQKRSVQNNELKYPPKMRKTYPKTEVEDVLLNAKEEMLKEMEKQPSKRCSITLRNALKVSFSDRKAHINTNHPLKSLKDMYPAFFTFVGITHDFDIAYNSNLKELIRTNISSCSSAVLKYAEKKKVNKGINLEESNLPDSELVQTIMLIPKILRENSDFIFKFFPVETLLRELEESIITPHLCVIGGPNSKEVYVVAEKNILVECCDFLEGVASLIGLYFTANIEFPKEAVATYKFFQSYVLKLSCKKLPGKLISFCKSLP